MSFFVELLDLLDAPRAVSPSSVPCVLPLHGGRPMLCDTMVGWTRRTVSTCTCACLMKPVAIPQVQFLDKVTGPSLLRLVLVAVESPQVQFLVSVYMPVASGADGQTALNTV